MIICLIDYFLYSIRGLAKQGTDFLGLQFNWQTLIVSQIYAYGSIFTSLPL